MRERAPPCLGGVFIWSWVRHAARGLHTLEQAWRSQRATHLCSPAAVARAGAFRIELAGQFSALMAHTICLRKAGEVAASHLFNPARTRDLERSSEKTICDLSGSREGLR